MRSANKKKKKSILRYKWRMKKGFPGGAMYQRKPKKTTSEW